MEINDVFFKRRSVRSFKKNPVPDDYIEKILSAAALAPTARNIQPWEFIIIRNPVKKNEIARLASVNASFISGAAVCIAVVCKDTKYYLEDGCAATTVALLAAASLGLGACWVAGDKKDYCLKVRDLLSVPEGFKLVSLIALGFPDEKPSPKKRSVKETIHLERL